MSETIDKKLVVLKRKDPGHICFISRYNEKGVLQSQAAMKGWANWEKDPKWELVELENVPFTPELEGHRSRYTRYSGDTIRIRHPVHDVIFEISMQHFFEILFREGIDEGFKFRFSYYIKGTSGSITLIRSDADIAFFEGAVVKKEQIDSREATNDSVRKPVWFPQQKAYGYYFATVKTVELVSRSHYSSCLLEGYRSSYNQSYNTNERELFYLPEKKAYITSSKDYYEVVPSLPVCKVDPDKTLEMKKPYWIKDSVEITTDNILNMTYFPNWSRKVNTSDGTEFVLFINEALPLLDTKSGIYYSTMSLLLHTQLRVEDRVYVEDPEKAEAEFLANQQRTYAYKLTNSGKKEADEWLAAENSKPVVTWLSSAPYVFKGDRVQSDSPKVRKEKNAAVAHYYVRFPTSIYRAAPYYNYTGKPLDPALKAAFEAAEQKKVEDSMEQHLAWKLELEQMIPSGFLIGNIEGA